MRAWSGTLLYALRLPSSTTTVRGIITKSCSFGLFRGGQAADASETKPSQAASAMVNRIMPLSFTRQFVAALGSFPQRAMKRKANLVPPEADQTHTKGVQELATF
jgi:hypothetical protein